MKSIIRKYLKLFFAILLTSVLIFNKNISEQPVTASGLLDSWEEDVSLLGNTANHYSFSYSNYIYTVGGSTSNDYPYVEKLNTLSTLPDRSWSYITELNKPLYWFAGVTQGNRLYLLGGTQFPPQTSKDFVDLVIFDSRGGDIFSQTSLNPLPQRLSEGVAVVADGYIYFSGGWTDNRNQTSGSKKVYFAKILENGNISEWRQTVDLPEILWGHGMFEHGGYIFVLGGQNGSGTKNNVYRAKINKTDGKLDSWTTVSNIPLEIRDFGITKFNDYVFLIGGRQDTASSLQEKIYYTQIDTQGGLSVWETSPENLPSPFCCGSASSNKSHIYITGGKTNTSTIYTNKVYRAKINTTPSPTPTPTPSPTPSPTPTPTPSPSPTPSYISLSVPDIKQFVGGWENDLYDHTSSTISALGCALTSATMVLQYYGFDWVTPDILNDWLNNEVDGYVRNGLVNWLAIGRFSHPKLEYLRLSPTFENIMDELENNRPGIIEVPGHFIVSKGETETSFEINDPGYSDRETLSVYQDLITLNTFTPSETDLSYMMFVADEDIVMQLFDELGNLVPTQNFFEEPIVEEGTTTKSGETLSILLFSKPSNGNYTLSVSGGSGSYKLDTYLYDVDGNVVLQNFNGILFGNEKDEYPISFEFSNNVEMTYEQILADLDNAYKNKLIRRRWAYKSLRRKIQRSQKYYNRGRKYVAKAILRHTKRQIKWYTPWFINSEVSLSLYSNLSTLISSL